MTSLDDLDPAQAWQPWTPSASDKWDRKWAAHLYRRAAFGSSPADLAEAERLGPQGTLDLLLKGRPEAAELLETLIDVGRVAAQRDDDGYYLRCWWLYCMLHGRHPLREKMVLFWHNHFATSIAKVRQPGLMFNQNCLIRRHALGNFGPFLQAMSKDGAMLFWLDSNSNVKVKPNENFARELMELFSLGVGNYTERDVQEAARAFTGWHTNGEEFKFKPGAHDSGPKTVLGQTGPFDGTDVVRVVLEQPATARFLVRKFYQFFISDITSPSDKLIEPLCAAFRKSGYDVAALVKTMLSSKHFYSEHAFRQRIKSPVEYVIGSAQLVYRQFDEKSADFRPLTHQAFVGPLAAMGQKLFAPPDVKGWRGGRAWLNTLTLVERDNFAGYLAMGTLFNQVQRPGIEVYLDQTTPTASTMEQSPPPRAYDPARLVEEENAHSPEEIVRVLLDYYMPGGARPDARARLIAYIAEDKPTGPALKLRIREAVHAIMTTAEYQLA